MDILAIDHVTLFVRSLEVVRSYYEDVFGLRVRELPGDAPRTLALESPSVHFFITEDAGIPDEFVRRQHISFQVGDLGTVIEQLSASGTPHEIGEYRGFELRSYRWCEWRDPAGIRVECVETLGAG